MKKIISLIILVTGITVKAQCPAPSNFTYTPYNVVEALLSWTETGSASAWELAVLPDFYVGAPLPTQASDVTEATSFLYTSLPPGCYVFFVRSWCSPTEVSPWTAVASSTCSQDLIDYLSVLSYNDFPIADNEIKIFPNPASDVIQITANAKVDKITLFDATGKVVLEQTQNNSEVTIEQLSSGIYLIEVATHKKKLYRKFIKK